jgi:hypothetical protein
LSCFKRNPTERRQKAACPDFANAACATHASAKPPRPGIGWPQPTAMPAKRPTALDRVPGWVGAPMPTPEMHDQILAKPAPGRRIKFRGAPPSCSHSFRRSGHRDHLRLPLTGRGHTSRRRQTENLTRINDVVAYGREKRRRQTRPSRGVVVYGPGGVANRPGKQESQPSSMGPVDGKDPVASATDSRSREWLERPAAESRG